jgi:hypothetical protein
MNRSSLIFAFTLATAALACSPKKPPPPPPDPEPTTQPEPPPPPPPKCESLDEKCKAKGGKKARIPQSLLVFEPVPGWTYAQGEKATVAQAGDEDACLALVGHEVDMKDLKKLDATRQAQLDALVAELKITLGKAKVNWKKSQDDKDGKQPLLNWGLEAVTRGSKKGELLIVSTAPNDGKAVFGIAFVPSDDANQSGEKLITSFHTLAPGEDKEK